MLTLNFTAGATTTTPIPFSVSMNTNKGLYVNGTGIDIRFPGIYEIVGALTLDSIAEGVFGVAIYAEGTILGSAFISDATGSGDTTTVPLYGVVEIDPSTTSDYATITFVPVGTPTVVSGVASIKKIS